MTEELFFDTLHVKPTELPAKHIVNKTRDHSINLRRFEDGTFGISLDEATTSAQVEQLFQVFSRDGRVWFSAAELAETLTTPTIPAPFGRTTAYLTHEVFHQYPSQ